jgi:hypothetical protein
MIAAGQDASVTSTGVIGESLVIAGKASCSVRSRVHFQFRPQIGHADLVVNRCPGVCLEAEPRLGSVAWAMAQSFPLCFSIQ